MKLLRLKKIDWHEFILFWVIQLKRREIEKKQENRRSVDTADCTWCDAFRESDRVSSQLSP